MPTRVLDIHPHIISPDTVAYPRAPLGGTLSAWARDRPLTFEELLRSMDEGGIDKSAIVHAPTCYGYDNSYVADAVAAHPERFTGVFTVDVRAPDAVEKIRYWAARNLAGLRLFTSGSTLPGQANWLADPVCQPAWDCAGDLGLPVCVMMKGEGIAQLKAVLGRNRTVTIVIDHLLVDAALEEGPPYRNSAPLFELVEYPNVFLKLTDVTIGASRKGLATPQSYFSKVTSEFGADRIAWGSNFPASARSLRAILQDNLEALSWASHSDLEWIFHKTAERLYPALRSTGN